MEGRMRLEATLVRLWPFELRNFFNISKPKDQLKDKDSERVLESGRKRTQMELIFQAITVTCINIYKTKLC